LDSASDSAGEQWATLMNGSCCVCVVVSSERNRYAISDESHAKSRGYKEL